MADYADEWHKKQAKMKALSRRIASLDDIDPDLDKEEYESLSEEDRLKVETKKFKDKPYFIDENNRSHYVDKDLYEEAQKDVSEGKTPMEGGFMPMTPAPPQGQPKSKTSPRRNRVPYDPYWNMAKRK